MNKVIQTKVGNNIDKKITWEKKNQQNLKFSSFKIHIEQYNFPNPNYFFYINIQQTTHPTCSSNLTIKQALIATKNSVKKEKKKSPTNISMILQ